MRRSRTLSALTCSNVRPSAFERGLFAGEILPANDSHVHVPRIDLDAAADALGEFGGHHRCAGTEERIVNRRAAFRVIQDRSPHALDRLLRAVDRFSRPGCGSRICPKRTLFAISRSNVQ